MNKNILILLVIIAIGIYLWKKSRDKSRVEMIDFLNVNVSNVDGKWTNMSNDELASVYKTFALIKTGIRPKIEDYTQAMDTLKKYGIENGSLVKV